ncbi:MAG: formamidopyrimidine-DNA glycosylase, partial [Leeuwenhoekiella sp.]
MELISGKTGIIKGMLMDQKWIAGIGNLYADEILFQCKIHPKTNIKNLTTTEKKSVFKEMKKVLKTVKQAWIEGEKLPENY